MCAMRGVCVASGAQIACWTCAFEWLLFVCKQIYNIKHLRTCTIKTRQRQKKKRENKSRGNHHQLLRRRRRWLPHTHTFSSFLGSIQIIIRTSQVQGLLAKSYLFVIRHLERFSREAFCLRRMCHWHTYCKRIDCDNPKRAVRSCPFGFELRRHLVKRFRNNFVQSPQNVIRRMLHFKWKHIWLAFARRHQCTQIDLC